MRIVPAIDLKDGKCVRLFKGDFARQTHYSDDPLAMAQRFSELKVSDLHVVDLDGAQSGEQRNREVIVEIAAGSALEVQLGGGIRDTERVSGWLDAGVARCVIGSLAVTAPETVGGWLRRFGPERIVLALDVRLDDTARPFIATHGWTRTSSTSLWDCMDFYLPQQLRHVLCTDVSRDGAMAGPNVDLYKELMDRYPDIQLQASGGVRNLEDLKTLRANGIPAAISGRALLDGAITADEVASFPQSE
ncbi:MAG: 1-(5-phosphoribosyl)-5-[(5-phosphoribosylamino)methylideneamino]imidazole-4-carboxamide isomerase [Pseudomonadota bacterium]